MKRTRTVILFLVIMTFGTGCTTGYWIDRGRDAADVFTATVGYGVGLQGRVGPLVPGVGVHLNVAGLESGQFFLDTEDQALCATVLIWGLHESRNTKILRERDKSFEHFVLLGFGFYTSWIFRKTHPNWPVSTQMEVAAGLGPSVKLGFNPGELVDFLLGWFTIDLADDDLERRKNEK